MLVRSPFRDLCVVSGCIGEMCKVECAIYFDLRFLFVLDAAFIIFILFFDINCCYYSLFFTWILLALHAYFTFLPTKYLLSTHLPSYLAASQKSVG